MIQRRLGKQDKSKLKLIQDDKPRVIEKGLENPIMGQIREIIEKPKDHFLYIDEFDNWHSALLPQDKYTFQSYWAVARHYGLKYGIFITRRYVQVPIYVRSSATYIYLNNTITAYDLDRVSRDRGLEMGKSDLAGLKQYQFIQIQ